MVSSWNIADYLPAPVDNLFIITVSEYMMNVWEQRTLTGSAAASLTGEEEAVNKKRKMQGLISSDLTQRLYQATSTLHKNPSVVTKSKKADKLPLAHMHGNNYALQFVTTVCHMLSLHKANNVAVYNLRRDLLKLIGVDDFSPESKFTDPAPSFVLQDTICDFCSHPQNLDLLRDPQLLSHKWNCVHCGNLYNKTQIEITLVDMVYRLSYTYQSQDLICKKCKLVKAENLSDICPSCSGTFDCRMNAKEFHQKLETLMLVSQFHEMKWLESVIELLKH